MNTLTSAEHQRYARHITLPEFGIEGQKKLKQASVLVIGAGGLGSPILMYLAAAGIGHLGIVDDDDVDLSNLQRQVLYTTADIGKSKVKIAKQRVLAMNPNIEVTIYPFRLTKDNVLEVFGEYDVIVDGTDNFPTRYLVNDACVLAEKVLVYGSIFRYEGQVAVFNYLKEDGSRDINYRDIFSVPPKPGTIPSCSEGGVLGVLPGMIGTIQANEVIKIITGIGEVLNGKLLVLNLKDFSNRILKIKKNPDIKITELIDYDFFCGLKIDAKINHISTEQLRQWQNEPSNFEVLDVRTAREFSIFNIGGLNIPLAELPKKIKDLDQSKKWVVVCQVGQRSLSAIEQIQAIYPSLEVYNLKGGLVRW